VNKGQLLLLPPELPFGPQPVYAVCRESDKGDGLIIGGKGDMRNALVVRSHFTVVQTTKLIGVLSRSG
jgi:hypothetical protein